MTDPYIMGFIAGVSAGFAIATLYWSYRFNQYIKGLP